MQKKKKKKTKENRETLQGPHRGKYFLQRTATIYEVTPRTDRCDYIQWKSAGNNPKWRESLWIIFKKQFVNSTSVRALIAKIYKELQELNTLINLPVNKRAVEMNRQIAKEEGKLANKCLEMASTSHDG